MEDSISKDTEPKQAIPGYSNVNEFSQQMLRSVLQATRSSNELPVGDDYDFYSTFSSVRDVMDIEGQRILSLLQRILRHQNVKGNIGPGASLDLEERFDVLMDTNDQILERVGTLLDEASGVKKQEAKLVLASTPRPKVSTSWNKKEVTPTNFKKTAAAYHLLTARNIQRPQVRFKDKIDNSNHPMKPSLREKPNALRSLEDSLKLPENVSIEDSEKPNFVHSHPYAYELEVFTPASEALIKVNPQEPKPVSLTPLTHVDTVEKLRQLLEDLRGQKEVAVDLEHHSYRSFQGLTCLMQISTRSHDYIVDTIDLRGDLHILNEVFTDPKITKVFHGADSDINWLQRDFGIYVVNMFDTGQAARVLGLSRFSLAHLLIHYCHVEADKQFQLADWRIRPLPEELIKYAREDTHYLLYIYDLMRNQLLDSGNNQANLILSVYSRSKMVASQVYSKPIFNESDYLELYKKSRKLFNNQQLAALRDLFLWRDQTARLEDESTGYVLPNHMLLQISEILPREHQGVLACCNPIPPLVRQNLPELHKMVLKAREIAITKVEKSVPKPSISQHPKYQADSLLHSRHDMTRQAEAIADIETNIAETGMIATTPLMFGSDKNHHTTIQINPAPIISAFSQHSLLKVSMKETQELVNNIRALFSNPFTKFLSKRDDENIIKAAQKDIWTLKSSTAKRKPVEDDGKVNLDSFEPEYAPPKKKAKVTVNLTSSANQSTSSKGKSIFGIPDSDIVRDPKKKDAVKEKISSKLQSLRDEVTKAKKRMKEISANKKNKEESKPDGKETENISSQAEKPMTKIDSVGVVHQKNKKKKNKKQKISTNELEGFDYEAVERQLKTDALKAEKPDVYDPLRPSKNKKAKGKKDLGHKSNKGKKPAVKTAADGI